jgi:hypoxanthine-guanine phosphoribosyltransferase
MDPIHSRETAKILSNVYRGSEILMIAMANGAVGPGMDVLFRYQSLTGSTESVFYPVRFSVYKSGDEFPYITSEEQAMLEELGDRREILIFDEDINSGQTIVTARDFFKENIFPNNAVMAVTNCNRSLVPEINPAYIPENIHISLQRYLPQGE